MREIGSLGVALDRQGKTDDAIAEFKKAIDVHFVGPLLRVLLSSLR
jgi:Flp pilus assembly protein TadD